MTQRPNLMEKGHSSCMSLAQEILKPDLISGVTKTLLKCEKIKIKEVDDFFLGGSFTLLARGSRPKGGSYSKYSNSNRS